MKLSDTIPLAAVEVERPTTPGQFFLLLRPIEAELVGGARTYALNLDQAIQLRDRLDREIAAMRPDGQVGDSGPEHEAPRP